MTREELVAALTENIVDSCDMDILIQYAYENLSDYFDNLPLPDLMEEARNAAPWLLNEED